MHQPVAPLRYYQGLLRDRQDSGYAPPDHRRHPGDYSSGFSGSFRSSLADANYLPPHIRRDSLPAVIAGTSNLSTVSLSEGERIQQEILEEDNPDQRYLQVAELAEARWPPPRRSRHGEAVPRDHPAIVNQGIFSHIPYSPVSASLPSVPPSYLGSSIAESSAVPSGFNPYQAGFQRRFLGGDLPRLLGQPIDVDPPPPPPAPNMMNPMAFAAQPRAPQQQAWNINADDWEFRPRTTRRKVTTRFRMPQHTARSRYGRSYRYATDTQKGRRDAIGYYGGTGRYHRKRKSRRGGHRRRSSRYAPVYARIGGRGSYTSDFLGLGGAAAGGALGGPMGSAIGGMLGQGIGNLIGTGAYAVNSNALVPGAKNTFGAPRFTKTSDTGSVVFSNREFIKNIYAPDIDAGDTSSFDPQTFDLNPGVEATFRWLSQVAANYEEYELGQLVFTFKTTVSEFTTTTGVVGQILGATKYNPDAPGFYDKQSMVSFHGSVTGKTNQNFVCGVECDPSKLAGSPGKYIRVNDLEHGMDVKDYDLGKFTLATVDMPSNLSGQMIGELWVSYTIGLRRPKLNTGRGNAISRDMFAIVANTEGGRIGQEVIASWGSTPSACRVWSENVKEVVEASENSIGCSITIHKHTVPTPGGIQRIGSIQFNSIPTNPPLEPDMMRITFPPAFTGNIEIQFTAGTMEGQAQPFRCIIEASGEVYGIDDIKTSHNNDMIYDQTNTGQLPESWLLNKHSCFSACAHDNLAIGGDNETPIHGIGYVVECRVHVNVKASTGGDGNFVQIGFNATTAGNFNIHLSHASLEISEYNASFNEREHLAPHELINPQWISQTTGQPVYLPTSI